MPKNKTRKNVDENFKVAAVQRLQTGGVPANDLAKELGASIWSLRRWSRQYRKRTQIQRGELCLWHDRLFFVLSDAPRERCD
jgi:transposase-like protein